MQQTQFETQIIDTPLGQLNVRISGTGPAILFWPSLMMDGTMCFGVADALPAAYRIILIDPPGHGGSARLDRPFDFATCAACVLAVADALDLSRLHFVGNSWGAMIGATFAATYPDRLDRAVLMNGTGSACGLRQRIEYRLLIRMADFLGGIRGPLRKSALAAFLGPTSMRSRPKVVEAVNAALDRVEIRSVRWAVESVVPRRPDQHALLATIRSPVMVVAGIEDATFPVAETKVMADAIPNASFVVMNDAAHLAGLECPRAVGDMIHAFLKGANG